jgi:phosphomannomutase / phosphoglucomutase
VVDEKGGIIYGDRLLDLYARPLLAKGPVKVVFEVKCSQAIVEDIQARGGTPIMWKAGHSLIKQKMKEEAAPLGGEMSGHMFFADRWYGFDDALYASIRLVEILASGPGPLSSLLADLPRYPSTPELRVNCPDTEKFRVVEEIKRVFSKTHETITVDGVRVLFGDGWGLVRASNTQPAIVVRFEAHTPERLAVIRRTILDELERFPSVEKLADDAVGGH